MREPDRELRAGRWDRICARVPRALPIGWAVSMSKRLPTSKCPGGRGIGSRCDASSTACLFPIAFQPRRSAVALSVQAGAQQEIAEAASPNRSLDPAIATPIVLQDLREAGSVNSSKMQSSGASLCVPVSILTRPDASQPYPQNSLCRPSRASQRGALDVRALAQHTPSKSAFSCFATLHQGDSEGQLRVEFTRSPSRRQRPVSCAHRSSASRMRLQWVAGRRKIVVVAGTPFAGGSTMLSAALTAVQVLLAVDDGGKSAGCPIARSVPAGYDLE